MEVNFERQQNLERIATIEFGGSLRNKHIRFFDNQIAGKSINNGGRLWA